MNDPISDRVGVTLISIPGATKVVLEHDAGALLNEMRGFVSRGVEIGLAAEGDLVAEGETPGSHLIASPSRRAVHVGTSACHIVTSKGFLDSVEMWQGTTGAGHAVARSVVNVGRSGGRLRVTFQKVARLVSESLGTLEAFIQIHLGWDCPVLFRRRGMMASLVINGSDNWCFGGGCLGSLHNFREPKCARKDAWHLTGGALKRPDEEAPVIAPAKIDRVAMALS